MRRLSLLPLVLGFLLGCAEGQKADRLPSAGAAKPAAELKEIGQPPAAAK